MLAVLAVVLVVLAVFGAQVAMAVLVLWAVVVGLVAQPVRWVH